MEDPGTSSLESSGSWPAAGRGGPPLSPEEEARARLAAIVESSDDAILSTSLDGSILTWNRGAERLFGWPADEAIGQNASILVPEERRAELESTLARVSEGERIHGETIRLRKDETPFPVEVTISPILSPDGAIVAVSWVSRDATERKQLEAMILRSERRYRQLFDASPLPMWVYDVETLRFLAVNEAAVRTYGWSREELLSMTNRDIRPPEELPALAAELASVPAGFSPPRLWRHRRKDGEELIVEISAESVEFGDRAGRLVLANDVTERTRAEAALKAAEEQLRQSQKMEAIGRLAGGVAHDFNNLLTAIIGYTDLLLGDARVAETAREELEEIRRAGERAAALTQQLLAFSRRQVLLPVVVDVGETVRKLTGLLRRLIGEHIEIVTTVAPGTGKVKADRVQLEQVILNLSINARDAMPDGGTLLFELSNVVLDEAYAREHLDAAPGRYVLIEVSDTGVGMDAATRARIFEPFFTTKELGRGTGLGLSTAHGIVRQSGGSIWVYSEPGRGTTFKVYLPCVDEEGESLAAPGAEPAVEPWGKETILLVEDEPLVRELARRVLERTGYTVLEAPGPAEALALSAAHCGEVHLLVTDVMLPGTNGAALAELLGRERPVMKVLFMSGYTDASTVQKGLREKTSAFLPKPFTPSALVEKVREVLDADAGDTQPPVSPG